MLGASTDGVCLDQKILLRNCSKRMRGYEAWEENSFLSSSGASGLARSNAVQQETSKQLLPKKDISALVFVTQGRQRWPAEERNDSSILGQVPSRVQGTRWREAEEGGGYEVVTSLGERQPGSGRGLWRRLVLSWVPRAGG